MFTPLWAFVVRVAALFLTLEFVIFGDLGPAWGALAVLLSLVLYELGHVLVGGWRGFRWQFLALGPVLLSRRGVRWLPRPAVGRTRMWAPRGGGREQDWRWYVAGGMVFSLLCAAALLVVRLGLGGPAQAFVGELAIMQGLYVAFALGLVGQGETDADRLWRLRPGGPERQATLTVWRMSTTQAQDVPAGGWPEEHVTRLQQSLSDPQLELLAASMHLDMLASRDAPLETALTRLEIVRPTLFQRTLQTLTDALLAFGAARQGDLERADTLLTQVQASRPAMRRWGPWGLLQAELALAVARQDAPAVRRLVAEARSLPVEERHDGWIDRFEAEAAPGAVREES